MSAGGITLIYKALARIGGLGELCSVSSDDVRGHMMASQSRREHDWDGHRRKPEGDEREKLTLAIDFGGRHGGHHADKPKDGNSQRVRPLWVALCRKPPSGSSPFGFALLLGPEADNLNACDEWIPAEDVRPFRQGRTPPDIALLVGCHNHRYGLRWVDVILSIRLRPEKPNKSQSSQPAFCLLTQAFWTLVNARAWNIQAVTIFRTVEGERVTSVERLEASEDTED